MEEQRQSQPPAEYGSSSKQMAEAIEFAWAAGLFEGEGCISFKPKSPTRASMLRRAAIGMTDLDVIERFHEVVGVGTINGPYVPRSKVTGKQTKPVWHWRCAKWSDLEPLLVRLEPFMGERRGAAVRPVLAEAA